MGSCKGIDFENDLSVPWEYCPAFAPAVLFTALFCLFTATHIVQAIIYKKKFCWVIIMGGSWETISFALRALGSKKIHEDGIAIPHQILLALAPLWVNAFVYMILGRMIYFFHPEKKCFGITAKRLTLIFVLLDVVAFLVQGASTSLMNSDTPEMVRYGIDIYMGGIGLQEFFICVFACLAIRFQLTMQRVERTTPSTYQWRPLLYAVYAGLALITMRIIYRLVEYSDGFESSLATNEAAFYVLDATTMSIAILLFNIFHPGRFLVGPESEFPKLNKQQKKEAKMQKKEDKKQKKRDKKNGRSNNNWKVLSTDSDVEMEAGGVRGEEGIPLQQSYHYDNTSNYPSGTRLTEMEAGGGHEERFPSQQHSYHYDNELSHLPSARHAEMQAGGVYEEEVPLQQNSYHYGNELSHPPDARHAEMQAGVYEEEVPLQQNSYHHDNIPVSPPRSRLPYPV